MKYQIADQNNGPFGEIYNSLQEAEAALQAAIAEGQALNNEHAEDGQSPADASDFFYIVALAHQVYFDFDVTAAGWREAQAAAAKFEQQQMSAGRVTGSAKDCEFYRAEFQRWLDEYQGIAKDAISVVVEPTSFEI